MSALRVKPTGVERKLGDDDIIVSKTDPSGRIIYVNQTLLDISDFTEEDLIGQQHSIVRHPEMPRSLSFSGKRCRVARRSLLMWLT
jgi:PAS domain S-box-containing protein